MLLRWTFDVTVICKILSQFLYWARNLRKNIDGILSTMWHIVIYCIHVLSNHIINDNSNVLFWPSIWQFMIGKIWACLSECTMMRERHIGFVLGWYQRASSYFMLKTSPLIARRWDINLFCNGCWINIQNKKPISVSISARFHVQWRRRL